MMLLGAVLDGRRRVLFWYNTTFLYFSLSCFIFTFRCMSKPLFIPIYSAIGLKMSTFDRFEENKFTNNNKCASLCLAANQSLIELTGPRGRQGMPRNDTQTFCFKAGTHKHEKGPAGGRRTKEETSG
jgi:hypothetical protein